MTDTPTTPTDTDLRDRVAAAFAEVDRQAAVGTDDGGIHWRDMVEVVRDSYRCYADAALAVVRPELDRLAAERNQLDTSCQQLGDLASRAVDRMYAAGAEEADRLRAERDTLAWLHAEAVWQRDQAWAGWHDWRRIAAQQAEELARLRAELADLREATTPPDGEDRRLVEDALHCAETGQAEHWPTVAAYLRGEVLWLRRKLGKARAADPRAAKHDLEEAHGHGYDDGYGHGYNAAAADRCGPREPQPGDRAAQVIHDTLCSECGDTGTGLTIRSADTDRAVSALAAAGLLRTEPAAVAEPRPGDTEYGIRHNAHVVIPCAEPPIGHPNAVQRDVHYGPWTPLDQDPSAPRIWTEHDDEPPVGTVGRNRGGRALWTRRDDGWHCDSTDCRNCPCEWVEVVGWGGTLTEAAEDAPEPRPGDRVRVTWHPDANYTPAPTASTVDTDGDYRGREDVLGGAATVEVIERAADAEEEPDERTYLILRGDFGTWLVTPSSPADAVDQFRTERPGDTYRGVFEQRLHAEEVDE